jgi:hypothetical protein
MPNSFRQRIAVALRAFADRLEPRPAIHSQAAPVLEPCEQTLFAQKFIDDLTIRDALRRSLRRYSPAQETAQA